MARADLLKRLLDGHQRRDDRAFRAAAEELIEEERLKHHSILANELQVIMANGTLKAQATGGTESRLPIPTDPDRGMSLVEIRTPDRYFTDLVLDERNLRMIERILREYRGWDVLQANGLTPVRRVLFCGPPGTGKTATAQAIAAELGLPLLYVRFDAVVSSLLGQTSSNIRRVFDFASNGQWIILFDEFDAVARSRDDVTEHGEIKRVVNSLLQIMDGFKGRSLILAATNFEESLDWAVWRRFDEVLRFPLPSADLLELYLLQRLAPIGVTSSTIVQLRNVLVGETFADAERLVIDLKRSIALKGSKMVGGEDISEAVDRALYRRSIMASLDLERAAQVDRE